MVTTPTSLLQRLREPDDRSAWERFVGLYTPVLYGWVRRCGVSVDEASDLVQEVFVTLIAVLPTFEYDRNRGFGSWLRTVVGNKCRDHFRRRAARPVASRGDLDPIGDDSIAELTEDEYRRSIARQALELMRSEFETKTWQACYETVVLGKGAAETAEKLGLTINAVYVAKSRVLRRLREELAGLWE
ncbi:MAG TPA: sigma-70 family RNA polymerase sigma factor [Pirellulaceae bacterium]|nr:sigma-70 family RNA polymerase sigma factor [Pirellulaceae bacterium]